MRTKNPLAKQAAAAGVTVRDLVMATGMSDAGVRKCLRTNALPRNPVLRDLFERALGIKVADMVGEAVQA